MYAALGRIIFRVLYFTSLLFFAGISAQVSADELAEIIERIKPVGEVCVQGQDCTAASGGIVPVVPKPEPVQEVSAVVEDVTAVASESVAAVEEVVEQKEVAETVAAVASVAEYTGRPGAEIYNKVCVVCHASGIAGSPKVGDVAAWAPRIAAGLDTMVRNAIGGLNAMPARGTCGDCSDDELRVVVQYMLDQSK